MRWTTSLSTASAAAPPAAPQGTAPDEEKSPFQYLSILERGDCRENGALGFI